VKWVGERGSVEEHGVDAADESKILVRVDPSYFRPTEVELLIGERRTLLALRCASQVFYLTAVYMHLLVACCTVAVNVVLAAVLQTTPLSR
jgi:GDP-D-mannose dehydratase